MTIALIDNGSVEAAAHLNLRRVAAQLSERTGTTIEAVSWRHSDRIPAAALDGRAALTLRSWLAAAVGRGEREFLFVPFFISPQGAIGSALRADLEKSAGELGGFRFEFAGGLADGDAIVPIVVTRIRESISRHKLVQPAVIVVDHGGPSPTSAALRNELAGRVRSSLGDSVRAVLAASMEGEDHPHNRPLLAEVLAQPEISNGAVVIAPLFLSPGRHAGPGGDLAVIAEGAVLAQSDRGEPKLECHFTELIGTHPQAVDALANSLMSALGHKRGRAAYP